MNAKVTGSFAAGITWDTATAGTAKLTIAQYMPLGTLFETITVTDSVGATVSKAITLNFLKGNRSLTETALATTIKYGDTTTVSGVGYPNGNACTSKIVNTQDGFTYVKFETGTACAWAIPAGVTSVTYLVVGGGGAGGLGRAGGGGAGGLQYGTMSVTPNMLQTITVGTGGAPGICVNNSCSVLPANGSPSSFGSTVNALGGGSGGIDYLNAGYTADKIYGEASTSGVVGSGGGNAMNWESQADQLRPGYGTPGQGNNGATGCRKTVCPSNGTTRQTGGGGGAGAPGVTGAGGDTTGTMDTGVSGTITPDGGMGLVYSLTGSAVCYAGGGGGATGKFTGSADSYISAGPGHGKCGGGDGAANGGIGGAGAANTGGGGGGGGYANYVQLGGAGGSGVVIVRFATPAPYAAPLVDGNLTYRTTTSSVCSVDTNTGAVAAYGSIGTCSIVADVPEGQYYLAESATINITVGKADTLTVTSYVTPNTLSFTNAMAAISETFSVVGLKAGDTITGVAKPVTYNFSAGATCATGGLCTLGQTGPGGGIVFYDAGSSQTWGRYLEVAPTGWSGSNETNTTGTWCSTNSFEAATLTGLGDGYANTLMLQTNCGASGNAANMVRSYTGGGFQDWYLPAQNEADQLMAQDTLTGINLINQASIYYWTSTSGDVDSLSAMVYYPLSNTTTSGTKSVTWKVRPIRAFDTNILLSTMDTPTNVGTYKVLPSNLTLASAKPLTNYQAVVYVADTNTGKVTINKANQAALTVDPVEFAWIGESITLLSTGGTSSKATIFKISTLGATASGCALVGNKLGASSAGTCRVYAIKPADINYYAVVAPVIAVRFDTFTVRVTITVPQGGGNMTIAAGAPVLDTSTPVPTETLTVISFSPTAGSPGTVITIIGTGFISAGYTLQSVRVGRNLTNVPIKSVSSNTTILATVDTASSSGRITLTFGANSNGATQEFVVPGGVFSFTPAVVASQPTITSFTPTTGVAGTSITITGTNFNGTTRVTIGGSPVDSFTINSSTSITAVTAVGSAAGTIAVTNADGTGASSGSFTSYNAAPNITLSSSSVTADSVTAVSISVTGNTGGPVASYNLLGTLPLGLTFNSSTGAVTGTPQEAHATSTYTVEAINPMGTGTATFTLTTTY